MVYEPSILTIACDIAIIKLNFHGLRKLINSFLAYTLYSSYIVAKIKKHFNCGWYLARYIYLKVSMQLFI